MLLSIMYSFPLCITIIERICLLFLFFVLSVGYRNFSHALPLLPSIIVRNCGCSRRVTVLLSQSFPLGVKIVKKGETLPEGSTRPSKYDLKISLCQWTTMARRWGRNVGVLTDDINCTPCLAALGLKKLESDFATYLLDMGGASAVSDNN